MTQFDLRFDEHAGGRFIVAPQFAVALQGWTDAADGSPLLTKRCVSFEDLDAEINRLKDGLDQAREHARVKYQQSAAKNSNKSA